MQIIFNINKKYNQKYKLKFKQIITNLHNNQHIKLKLYFNILNNKDIKNINF